LSKSKVNKARAHRSATDGVGGSPFRSQIIHLNSIPIADPWREKKMFEKGEFARKLNPDYGGAVIAQDEDGNRRRIIEVYRQCFESSDSTGSRLKVIRDFAAYFPDLLFDAYWIKEFIRRESVEIRFSKAQKEVLDAILTGLRAVKSPSGKSAVQKYFDIAGAQKARQNIQDQLSKWNECFQRDLAHPQEWIAERVAEKADELVQTYSIRGARAKQRLKGFLELGHCYEAATLIASERFKVPERDLESKLE
jgi:hypothetical protein